MLGGVGVAEGAVCHHLLPQQFKHVWSQHRRCRPSDQNEQLASQSSYWRGMARLPSLPAPSSMFKDAEHLHQCSFFEVSNDTLPPLSLVRARYRVHTMQVFRPLSAVHTRPQLPLWSYARTPRPHVPAIRSTLPSTVPGRRPTTRCIESRLSLPSPPLPYTDFVYLGQVWVKGHGALLGLRSRYNPEIFCCRLPLELFTCLPVYSSHLFVLGVATSRFRHASRVRLCALAQATQARPDRHHILTCMDSDAYVRSCVGPAHRKERVMRLESCV